MGPESRDPQRVLTPCAHNMVLGDGEDDVAVGVVFDLREGTLVARKQNRPHVDGVDERGDVSGGGGVIGGRCPTNLMTLLSLSGCQLRSGMVLALTDRPAQTAVAPTRRRDASASRFRLLTQTWLHRDMGLAKSHISPWHSDSYSHCCNLEPGARPALELPCRAVDPPQLHRQVKAP
jgi:hypothetical protein